MKRPAIGFRKVTAEGFNWRNGKAYPKFARWDGQPARCPMKGEYFLSGALPTAYRAKADMTTPYFIAVLTGGTIMAITYADLYQILTEAELRVEIATDPGVRERSAETVSLVKQRMAKEGLTRDVLERLAGVKRPCL